MGLGMCINSQNQIKTNLEGRIHSGEARNSDKILKGLELSLEAEGWGSVSLTQKCLLLQKLFLGPQLKSLSSPNSRCGALRGRTHAGGWCEYKKRANNKPASDKHP